MAPLVRITLGADPILAPTVNPRWRAEEMLRSGAEYDDAEIKIALDTKEYNNKEEAAYAHEAIQEIQAGKKPDQYYGATTLFMQMIHDFAVNNRSSLGLPPFRRLSNLKCHMRLSCRKTCSARHKPMQSPQLLLKTPTPRRAIKAYRPLRSPPRQRRRYSIPRAHRLARRGSASRHPRNERSL